MREQNFQQKTSDIRAQFQARFRDGAKRPRLNLSWSNWGFGRESLAISVQRLAKYGVRFIELHGNHYGHELGYKPAETRKILADHGVVAGGVCGMYARDCDLSHPSGIVRQLAIDYTRREIDFAHEVGASYLLVVPGACGRPDPYDNHEWARSVDSLRMLGDQFAQAKVKAAIEPIRHAEVTFVHSIADAKRYLKDVNHPAIGHINGDAYHMQTEESHVASALIDAGDMLVNLHMADSNRCALGDGSLDLDAIIMALYLIGYNSPDHYVTPEPLGPGAAPYPAMHGEPNAPALDRLVQTTAEYFRAREEALLAG